jgi:hypothetical protein
MSLLVRPTNATQNRSPTCAHYAIRHVCPLLCFTLGQTRPLFPKNFPSSFPRLHVLRHQARVPASMHTRIMLSTPHAASVANPTPCYHRKNSSDARFVPPSNQSCTLGSDTSFLPHSRLSATSHYKVMDDKGVASFPSSEKVTIADNLGCLA